MYTIRATNLSKHYTQHKKQEGLKGSIGNLFRRETYEVSAIKDISFAVERGEILGLIGPNGAGKTTTIKMMSGLLSPSGGSIEVLGFNPFDNRYFIEVGIDSSKSKTAWHAVFVEYGTPKMPADPGIRPAFDKGRIKRIQKQVLKKEGIPVE